MKLVLFAFAVLVLLWLLRGGARRSPPSRPTPEAGAGASPPQAMLKCAHCGVHMPRDEALPGRGGVFCGEAHRAEFEKSRPAG
jgi:uncharacterized protein